MNACGISVWRCLCQTRHSQLNSRSSSRARKRPTDCSRTQRGILERFYSTDYMEAERVARQACSQVLQVSYGGTVSCLCTRHQCLPPTWRGLKIPQSKGYSQCLCDFPSLGSRPWKITYHRGKYGSQIKKQLFLIWMPRSSFFKTEVIFSYRKSSCDGHKNHDCLPNNE